MRHIQKIKKSRSKVFFVVGALLGVVLLAPLAVFAQVTINQQTGTTFGLGTADLESTVIKVVQWALGILGLIAVIIIMYGGFIWMTAAGNADKVATAKKIIVRAVIGLVIILLAWAIVTFVISRISDATSGAVPNCTAAEVGLCRNACQRCFVEGDPPASDPTCGGGASCGGGSGTSYLSMKWYSPRGTAKPICTIMQAGFSENLDETTVNNSNILVQLPLMNAAGQPGFPDQQGLAAGQGCTVNKNCLSGVCTGTCQGTTVPGTFTTLDSDGNPTERFKFAPSQDLEKDATYQVLVTTGLDAVSGRSLSASRSWTFSTGTESDTEPPTVVIGGSGLDFDPFPTNDTRDICLAANAGVTFSEEMDSFSVSNATFNIATSGGIKANASVAPIYTEVRHFKANPTANFDASTEYEVTLKSGDPANRAGTGIRDVCGNPLDGNNNGTVSYIPGPPPTTDDYAPQPSTFNGDGAGGATTDDPDWIFETGVNASCTPKVDAIVPSEELYGRTGNPSVTVQGANFEPGYEVEFANSVPSSVGCFTAGWVPDPVVNACVNSVNTTQIVTEVPSGDITDGSIPNGARDGKVKVYDPLPTGESSNTVDFKVRSPRVRSVSPQTAGIGSWISILGTSGTATPSTNFGAVAGRVYFRSYNAGVIGPEITAPLAPCSSGSWTPMTVVAVVPAAVVPGQQYVIQVERADGQRSNLILFNANNSAPGPGLCPLTNLVCPNPQTGNTGSNTLATGALFGNVRGTGNVNFTNPDTGASSVSPITTWGDAQIDLRVPNVDNNDSYIVDVRNNAGQISNAVNFGVPCTEVPQLEFSTTCDLAAAPQVFPSPNPRDGATDVCRNVVISGRFSVPMQRATVETSANIFIQKCTSPDCSTVDLQPPLAIQGYPIAGDPTSFQMNLVPAGTRLERNAKYKVTVSKNLRSAAGAGFSNDITWTFTTVDSDGDCPVDGVTIDPRNLTSSYNPPLAVTYNASAYASSCEILDPTTYTWGWASGDATIATFVGDTDPVADATLVGNEGTSRITASIPSRSKSASTNLTVKLDYCQKNSDCTKTIIVGGVPQACVSTCNLAAERCEPHVNSMSPASGPIKTITTIRGCYFGPRPGEVNFNAIPAEFACGPSTWKSDGTDIKVASPGGFVPGNTPAVTVKTAADFDSLVSNPVVYTYSDACANGSDVPTSGVPGVCSVSPSTVSENDDATVKGLQFPNGNNPLGQVTVEGSSGRLQASTVKPWNADPANLISTTIPTGSISGALRVLVDDGTGTGSFCESNDFDITIKCGGNSDCTSGCCVANACVNSAFCSTGGIGQACSILNLASQSGGPHPALDCRVGPEVPADPSRYVCIANSGFTKAKDAPPPAYGGNCAACCDADLDGNPATNDPQTANGGKLVCTPVLPGSGTCESSTATKNVNNTQRGLYCGCDDTPGLCGAGNGCSTASKDPVHQRCCRSAPTVLSIQSPLQCRNQGFNITFSEPVERSSVNTSSITVTVGGTPVPGRFTVSGSVATFLPDNNWNAGNTINVTVSTNVKNRYGIPLQAAYAGTAQVAAAAQICTVDHVVMSWVSMVDSGLSPSLFTCARDSGCPDDLDPAVGNQHYWSGFAVDQFNNPLINVTYSWTEDDPNDTFDVDAGCPTGTTNPFSCLITANGVNGYGLINVAADGTAFGGGTASAKGRINTNICEQLWPNPNTSTYPFNDAQYNFNLSFCRDEGNLPTLFQGVLSGGVTAPVVTSYVPAQAGVDEVLRQYTFLVTDDFGTRIGSADKIGLRIMENELHLPPDLWFKRNTGKSSSGGLTTLAGFEAVKIGRSTYIAGTNIANTAGGPCRGPLDYNAATKTVSTSACDGGIMYSDMYIFSYEGDAGETAKIYEKLVASFEPNTNAFLTTTDKAGIARDSRRIHDINRASLLFSDYNKLYKRYPALPSGSYVNDISVSTWPSWKDTMSQLLGGDLPVDPLNKMQMCPLAYQKVTGQELVMGAGQLPAGVAQDANGNVFVVNYAGVPKVMKKCNDKLQSCTDVYTFGGTDFPTSVTVDKSNGDILVGIGGASARVLRFDASNLSVPEATYAIPNVSIVVTDKDGNLFVTRINNDNGIYKYNPDGTGPIASRDTGPGSCATGAPEPCMRGIHVDDAAGEVYAVDQNNGRVNVYNTDLTVTLRSYGGISSPVGIDKRGDNVFVTEHLPSSPSGNRILELDKELTTIKNVVRNATIQNPYAIVATNNGFMFANYTAGRVQTYAYSASAAQTCWDDANKLFTVPPGSHVYQYTFANNFANVFALMEYLGPGSWRTVPNDTDVIDACDPAVNAVWGGSPRKADCRNYNFQLGGANLGGVTTIFSTQGVPDTTGPTNTTFTVPNPITGTTLIRATATDAGSGMSRVEFYIDDILRFTDTTNDYEWDFNPAAYLDGFYDFKMVAFDRAGNRTEIIRANIQIQKTVTDKIAPQLSGFTPPAVITGTITLQSTASDADSGIERVEYFIGTDFVGACLAGDACNVGTSYRYTWNSATVSDGTYQMYAVAFDNAGNSTVLSRTVTLNNGVDLISPSVSITAPLGGTVTGTVSITATASDNQGVARLTAYINGTAPTDMIPTSGSFPNPDPTSPYRWAWDTSGLPNGNATIYVIATDVNGRTNQDQVTVFVDNTTGGLPSVFFLDPEEGGYNNRGTVTVYAEDDVAISRVDLSVWNGGTEYVMGSSSTGPQYTFSWPSSITLPDGNYRFRATAYDNVGNSRYVEVNFTLDTTPPTMTSFTPPDGSTLSGLVNFASQATDANPIIDMGYFNFDQGIFHECFNISSCSLNGWDSSALANNNGYLFVAFAVDAAHNSGTIVYYYDINNTGGADTIPPIVSNIFPTPELVLGANRYTLGAAASITVAASDNAAVQYIDILINNVLQGGPHTCTNLTTCVFNNWNTTAIADGTTIELRGRAHDTTGNISADLTKNVIIDNSPPSMAAGSVIDDGATTSNNTQLHAIWGAATEPHTPIREYQYSIGTSSGATDVVGWTSSSTNAFVTHTGLNLASGTTYYFNVKAINATNLESNIVSSDGIQYVNAGADTTPPTDPVIVVSPLFACDLGQCTTGNATITVTSTDSAPGDTGIGYIDVFIGANLVDTSGNIITAPAHTCASSPCVVAWNTAGINGPRTISAVAGDNAAPTNTSNTSAVSVTVDSDLPVLAFSAPGNNYYVGGTVAIQVGASDAWAGIQKVDVYYNTVAPANFIGTDTTWQYNFSWATSLGSPPDGDYTLIAVATDYVGHTAQTTRLIHLRNTNASQNCGTLICTLNCCSPSNCQASCGGCTCTKGTEPCCIPPPS